MTIGPYLSLPPSPASPSSPPSQTSVTDSMRSTIMIESLHSPPYSPSSSPISTLFGVKNKHRPHRYGKAVLAEHPYSQTRKDRKRKRSRSSDGLEDDLSDFLQRHVPEISNSNDSLLLGTHPLTPPQTPTYPSLDQDVQTNFDHQHVLTETADHTSPIPHFSRVSAEEHFDASSNIFSQQTSLPLPCQTSPSPQDVEEKETISTDGIVTQNLVPESDAMLSSSSMVERQNSSTGSVLDTDFLKELDDLDFDFGDFDPCCDVKLDDDSFQEFIESTLDDAFPEEFDDMCSHLVKHKDTANSDCVFRRYRRNSSSPSNEPVIVDQAGFMEVLGLRPSTTAPIRAGANSLPECNSSSSCDLSQDRSAVCSQNFNSVRSSPFDLIPTKMSSSSCSGSHSESVYTLAKPSSTDSVSTCSSLLENSRKISCFSESANVVNNKLNKPSCSSCQKLRLDASQELLPPLSIDTYNYGVLPPSESTAPRKDVWVKSQSVGKQMEKLLEILAKDAIAQENIICRENECASSQRVKVNLTNSVPSVDCECDDSCDRIDPESFKDLSLLLDDSLGEEMDIAENPVSSDVHHDHTYQKTSLTYNNSNVNDVSNSSASSAKQGYVQSSLNVPLLSEDNFFCFSHTSEHFPQTTDSPNMYASSPQSHDAQGNLSNILEENKQRIDVTDFNSSLSDNSSLTNHDSTLTLAPKASLEAEEKNQLELLNLFSDESVLPLFYQESSLRQFRFV